MTSPPHSRQSNPPPPSPPYKTHALPRTLILVRTSTTASAAPTRSMREANATYATNGAATTILLTK